MNKANLLLWIEALESDKYKQGKKVLANVTDNTFCCLGVLCEVAIEHGVDVIKTRVKPATTDITDVIAYNGDESLPPKAVVAWLGVDASNQTITVSNKTGYLTWHNDVKGATFKDIAAGLRAHYLSGDSSNE